MNTYLGIECSDGDPCECCGTPCPRRRIVVQTMSGDIRRLGSTCASFSLKRSDAVKQKSEEAVFTRQENAIRKASDYLAKGMGLDQIRNWLSCWVRCELDNGRIRVHQCFGGKWTTRTI